MAIFHLSAQVISRGAGGNAKAAAAYRAGEKVGEFDYSPRERTVDYTNILAPKNAPEWCLEREKLWEAVEASEKRKDAQLCREFNLALPLELKAEEQIDLINRYAENFVRRGMVADIAIHNQNSGNPHAHIMLTMRELTPEGFGQKVREWNKRELVREWREQWAGLANAALEKAGQSVRIDHRTLKAQGVDREPTAHQGKAVTWMERKGPTLVGELNHELRELAQKQREIARCRVELVELDKIHVQTEKRSSEAPRPKIEGVAQKVQKPQMLAGYELLRTLAKLENKKEALQIELNSTRRKLSEADDSYKKICNDISEHNNKVKNMGVFDRIVNTFSNEIDEEANRLEQKQRDIKSKYNLINNDYEKIKKKLEVLSDVIKDTKERYKKSPHGIEKARIEKEIFEIEKKYGDAIQKLIRPDHPKSALTTREYKEYIKNMQAASPEQRKLIIQELKHTEKRYEVQELFSLVAMRTSKGTSIAARERVRDEMLKQWDKSKPEQRLEMEQQAREFVKSNQIQHSRGMHMGR